MAELDTIDELLGALNAVEDPSCALLLEHLESARFYGSGAMPLEYRMSLAMAREQLYCLSDRPLRARASDFIRRELSAVVS